MKVGRERHNNKWDTRNETIGAILKTRLVFSLFPLQVCLAFAVSRLAFFLSFSLFGSCLSCGGVLQSARQKRKGKEEVKVEQKTSTSHHQNDGCTLLYFSFFFLFIFLFSFFIKIKGWFRFKFLLPSPLSTFAYWTVNCERWREKVKKSLFSHGLLGCNNHTHSERGRERETHTDTHSVTHSLSKLKSHNSTHNSHTGKGIR